MEMPTLSESSQHEQQQPIVVLSVLPILVGIAVGMRSSQGLCFHTGGSKVEVNGVCERDLTKQTGECAFGHYNLP